MLDKNIKLNWVKTSKFNTVALLISFINERKEENISKYVMLSAVLGSLTEKYNTKKSLNEKLYSLYNCNIYWASLNMYKNENVSLYVEFINPSVVKDENLLDEIFDLINEFLYCPLLNDSKDSFEEKNFNEKKRLILEQIDSLYNNKEKYAVNKLLSHMRREKEFPLSNLVSREQIESLSSKELYEFYKYLLNNSFVAISGMGDIDFSLIEEKMSKFNLKSNEINMEFYSKKDYEQLECKYIEETQDIKQAKLNIAFRTSISASSAQYPAYVVFSTMFGGMFNSTLSNVVREKLSLAYNIYNNILVDKKIMTVHAGIDSSKVKEVTEIILSELKKYQSGNIEEGKQLFKMAKECILNDMLQVYDTQGSLLIRKLKDSITDTRKYDDLIKDIYEVKYEEIISCSKELYLDTIFVLKGSDNYE